MADNPFSVLQTPDSLEAARLAAASNPDQPIWTQVASQAGAGLRQGMVGAGVQPWLTAEDRKAAKNQQIMQAAQSKYADYIKDGKMTSDDAQAAVLEDAIRGFSANGNWEQAISLTQPLNQLKKQQIERRKLTAEAANAEAQPEDRDLTREVAQMKADSDFQTKMQALQIAELKATNAGDRIVAQNELSRALAEKAAADAELARARASWGPTQAKQSPAMIRLQKGQNDTVISAAGAMQTIGDLRELIAANPSAATWQGTLSTRLAKWAGPATAQATSQPEVGAWLKQNVADAKIQGLTVQLAYAFARSVDPNGRISDKDLEAAKKIVSGEGSPAARLAVLDQAFTQLARNSQNGIISATSSGIPMSPEVGKIYHDATDRYSSLTKRSAIMDKLSNDSAAAGNVAGPPRGLSAAEFKAWKAQHPNWKP
jgi:hypothetical protein